MVSDDFIAVSDVTETAVCDTWLLVFRDGMSKRRQPKPTERVPYLPELGEKGLRLLQILGVEALSEPFINGPGTRSARFWPNFRTDRELLMRLTVAVR